MKSIILASALSLCIGYGFQAYSADAPSINRQYPGGSDEQDLHVQTEMVDPALKTDRKTFEQKIMQNIFKKNTAASEGDAKTSSSKPASKPAKKN